MAGCRPLPALVALLVLVLAGCKNRTELIENELRARDIQYREALEELNRTESYNQTLQQEIAAIRQGSKVTPEQAAQLFGIKRIVLGRLTGGYDGDGLPGDELLQVIIEPRDASDHTLKTPGSAQITALEINPQGAKISIGDWTIGPDDLRKSWKQTLLSTGYVLRLPWQALPLTENVRVAVRLILPDGRSFETDRDVKVRLVPGRGPLPRPSPPLEEIMAPSLMPAPAAATAPTGNVAAQWQPAPLQSAVQLGRPLPHVAPSAIPSLYD